MSIRWKLLLLLLGIALVPVAILAMINRNGMQKLGADLADRGRTIVTERTAEQLRQLIRDQAKSLRILRHSLENTLQLQAREVEQCLARGPSETSAPAFFSEDFGRDDAAAPRTVPSDRHFRFATGAAGTPIPITYEQQVYKLAPKVPAGEVSREIACLGPMPEAYKALYQGHAGLIYWQFTGLENGVYTSYPGHGGYPPEFDHRERDWYVEAKQNGALTWIGPYLGVSSEQLILTLSMPVRAPDGEIRGVTGIDVNVRDIVENMKVPPLWSRDARAILVFLEEDPAGGRRRAKVLAQPGYHQDAQQRWNAKIEADYLESDDTDRLSSMIADMSESRSGRAEMRYGDRESLWVYGPVDEEGTNLVIILPLADVVAQAAAVEREARESTDAQVRIASALAGLVFLIVLLFALIGSRTVTEPVRELAATADRIAAGEFDARVRIHTHDELGKLGQRFNEMVPQLEERMNLKQSLELAMEVQQSLLPSRPPVVEGLDVAGKSIYCDETGGDYFDFLNVAEMNAHRVGVAIGDVTGHGIAAALLMTTARALLRSHAAQATDLARLMNTLNADLAHDMEGGQFMTLYYLVLDTRTREARWVSAGHDAAIVYDPADDSFSELTGVDIPLGIEPAWEFKEHGPVLLKPGQVVVIGTDGIWEGRDPDDEFFGKDRLREVIRRKAASSAADISDAITDALREFARGRAPEDDITLVTFKLTGE